MKIFAPALTLLIAFAAVGCDTATEAPEGTSDTAAALIMSDADLVTFRYAASATGTLRQMAYDDETFTVLAATNDAFATAAQERGVGMSDVLGRPDMGRIMRIHVIKGQSLAAADLTDGQEITTEAGATLVVRIEGERIGFDADADGQADAYIASADIAASNGTIHKVDHVFVPAE